MLLKGRGMLRGIDVRDPAFAEGVKHRAYAAGLILETCGPNDTVLKLMPPLNIDKATLDTGLGILVEALMHDAPKVSRITTGARESRA
jgi:diaminobutyrate-2-oxoglutarate transaminase